jgi:hypothetical protein
MPVIFLILSLVMLSYSGKEPHCLAGAAIFAALGIMLLSVNTKTKKK